MHGSETKSMDFIAHRGIPSLYPENTASSFMAALNYQPDQIECDIQCTKDGHFVVFHDFTVDRMTDGSGYIHEMTLDEIKMLSVKGGEKILSLEEFLQMIPSEVTLNLELKRLTEDKRLWEQDFVKRVLQFRSRESVIFASLNHECLRRIGDMEGLRLAVAMEADFIGTAEYLLQLPFSVWAFHPSTDYLDRALFQELHAHGIRIQAWCVDDEKSLMRAKNAGVDAVMTNKLNKLKEGQ